MKKHLFFVSALIILLLALGGASVLAQNTGTVEFSNLPDGATVSELTTLTGTIEFPDFLKYEIFLKNGHQLTWVANSHSPVKNGGLARLDPRVFASGSYQVIVREVHPDSNYVDVPGPTITIDNQSPAPYYPEVEPSFLYPAEGYALVRARNCAGEDFFFDYQSPDGSGSAGEVNMPGKSGDTICIFSDFILKPAEYRGTAKGGAQNSGQPIEFLAEAGKVYDLTYVGNGNRIVVQEIPGDSVSETASGGPEYVEPTKAPATAMPAATKKPVAAPTKAATPKPMLPITGQTGGGAPVWFGIGALALLAILIGGGVLAAKKRQPQ